MEYSFLLASLENVLGKSKHTTKDNYSFICPFCCWKNPKLEVKMLTDANGENPWACWRCGQKGKKIRNLLRKINLSREEAQEVLKYIKKDSSYQYVPTKEVSIPKEFVSLIGDNFPKYGLANKAKNYLYDRGVTKEDIIKYNIGYCESGTYAGRVIIPSYDSKGFLNYFVSRSFEDAYKKYLLPDASRDIIFFENLINWNVPIILVEGVFDAMAVKRNVIPLLGKSITKNLMIKIIESSSNDIYIALDNDALDKALDHCKKFLDMGKRVFLVDMYEKDPSEMGFAEFTKHIQKSEELTFSKLLRYKLKM